MISEWEELADPIAAAAVLAEDLVGAMAVWTVGERYVVPGPATQSLVQRTLVDERVEKALENSSATLRHETGRGGEWPLRQLYEILPGFVQPVVLGLAVIGTMQVEAGAVGRWLNRRFDEVQSEVPGSGHDLMRRFRRSLDQM